MFSILVQLLSTAIMVFEEDDLPPYDPFVSLEMQVGDRAVALNYKVAGQIACRHVDPEGVEDIYVLDTEIGRLVVPEAYLRPALA